MSAGGSPDRNRQLLAGGTVLTVGTLAANGGNYVLNLLLGRWLTPAEFADANLMVTLMLLATAIAIGLQLIVAKFVSDTEQQERQSRAVLRWSLKLGWIVGFALGFLLVVGANFWADLFRMESPWLFVILGAGLPFYIVQSCYRGLLQGEFRFIELAGTYLVEAAGRLAVSIGLVVAGFGVMGATIGLSASFIVTWLSAGWLATRFRTSTEVKANEDLRRAMKGFIAPTAILLVAQIIINNGDVLITKSSFAATDAGIYAAIALVGRAVFFLSWSVVTAFFPVASAESGSVASLAHVLRLGMAAVGGMCVIMCLGVALLGDFFLTNVLGNEYAGQGGLLLLYAVATSLFAVANYMASHSLASGDTLVAKLLLAAGLLQTCLVYIWRATAEGVIHAQLIAMTVGLGLALVALRDQLWLRESAKTERVEV